MRRSGTHTQMGPAAGAKPYIHSVRMSDGWLEVGLRRGPLEFSQRVHLVCIFDDGDAHVIHEGVRFPNRTKRAKARFKPTGDVSRLVFDPVVHVPDNHPQRVVETGEDALPTWIELRILNAARSSQEFDSLAARIEAQANGDELTITELSEDRSLSEGNS